MPPTDQVVYAVEHLRALSQWAEDLLNLEDVDRQYLAEEMLQEMTKLADDLVFGETSRETVLIVGTKNFHPDGRMR